MAELGEAGGRDQADPADSDHPYRLSLAATGSPFPLRLRVGDDHVRRARHAEHLVVGQRVEQVVGDPVAVVAAVPGDHVDAIAVDVDLVFAAVDRRAFRSGC